MNPSHRRILEATNAGHYFADCSCGWTGGVFTGRHSASEAHRRHATGDEPLKPVRTTFLLGGQVKGQ